MVIANAKYLTSTNISPIGGRTTTSSTTRSTAVLEYTELPSVPGADPGFLQSHTAESALG